MVGLGILLFIAHLLGDFFILAKRTIEKDNLSYSSVLLHAFIYQLVFLLLLGFVELNSLFITLIFIIGISHFVIHSITYYLCRYTSKKVNFLKNNLFFIEQILMVTLIFIGIHMMKQETIAFYFNLSEDNHYYLRIILVFLLINRPSNILFKKIFTQFKPISKETPNELNEDRTYKNAGAAIGTLERTLMMICLINQLYSSIGLILTAKSIARYNRISQEPQFSEYYLLGTLSSVLFAIIFYFIGFNLIP